jgi:hypothetical protein
MKLSLLLTQRPALLRQARLTNLAFAYSRLGEFASWIARARLHGEVNLKQAAPEAERNWASLTAIAGNQSVIEEHFTDEDLMDFADLAAFATGESHLDVTFPIEQMAEKFLSPLRHELERNGVSIDQEASPVTEPNHEGSSG